MPERPRIARRELWVAGLLVAATGVEAALEGVNDGSQRIGVGAGLVVAAASAIRVSAPVAAALASAAAIAVAYALGAAFGGLDAIFVSLGLVAYALGDLAEPFESRAAIVVLVLGTYGAQIAGDGGNSSPPLLYATAGPWIAGAVVRSRRLLADRLETTATALEAERATYIELAVERERRHIARELHDIVGHAMSLIVIQATAGRHLARTAPEQAGDALAAIVETGHGARAEVGRLRGVLNGGDAPGLDHVPEIVARAAAAGLDVRVGGRPGTVDLDPEVDRIAFRVLQEALTNAVKHAGGAVVDVVLSAEAGRLTVEVRNTSGRESNAAEPPGGRGLVGMAERCASVGGHLEAGPLGGGWRVRATLPCRPRGTQNRHDA